MSRILGIDYGERRIGLALSDPMGIIAKPLETVDRNFNPDYISRILDTAEEKAVKKIVVGIPLTMKGGRSRQTEVVQQFIKDLSCSGNIPIVEVDERLSSIAAKKALHEQGIKTGHDKGSVDKTAATIILQEYLDSQN